MKNNQITLKQLLKQIMDIAGDKGFGRKPDEINTLEKIALIHGEVSEAMEAYRRKNMDGKDGFAEELADCVIRILHLAGVYKIDIEKEIFDKLEHNKDRGWDWDKMNETHTG